MRHNIYNIPSNTVMLIVYEFIFPLRLGILAGQELGPDSLELDLVFFRRPITELFSQVH